MSEPDWRHHCAEPAAEQLLVATGRDIWQEVGGCPRSAREAADLYRRLGVTNFKDAVSAVLGEPVDPKLARRGAIALLECPGRGLWALGIVRGEWIECIDRMQPLSRAKCCWNLGLRR